MTAPAWLTTAEAAAHLRVEGRILTSLALAVVPSDLRAAALTGGRAGLRTARYRWRADRLDAWWDFVQAQHRARHCPEVRLLPDGRLELPEADQRTGRVYLIASSIGGMAKIGYTAKPPERRLGTLQTGSPVALVLIASFPGARRDEASLHRRFAESRSHGEWFQLTDELRTVFLRIVLERGPA